MIRESDTDIGQADSDMMCLDVSAGQRVRISVGLMEGLEAIVIRHLSSGRVLLRLQPGVYVEVLQDCLEALEKTR